MSRDPDTDPRPHGDQRALGDRRVLAIALALLGFATFSVGDAFVKHLSATYPLQQMFFTNAGFALIPVVILAMVNGGPRALATRRPGVQALRALLGMSVGLGAFHAFTHLPMAEVYAILFTAPLIIAGISALALGERLDLPGWLAVLGGFVGVVVILHPTGAEYDIHALAALFAAFAFAGSNLVVRHLGRGEGPATFPFYGCLMGAVVMGVITLFDHAPLRDGDIWLMAAGGISAGTGLCCMLNAFRLAPAPVVAPWHYSQMIWGLLIGALVFGDMPDIPQLAGSAIIIVCGVFLFSRERRRARVG